MREPQGSWMVEVSIHWRANNLQTCQLAGLGANTVNLNRPHCGAKNHLRVFVPAGVRAPTRLLL